MSEIFTGDHHDSDARRVAGAADGPAPVSRRWLLTAVGLSATLGACVPAMPRPPRLAVMMRGPREPVAGVDPVYADMYDVIDDGGFIVEPINLRRINSRLLRREVPYSGADAPGSIVVDIPARYLYFVMPGGRAMRYGVGVGREEGFNFRGTAIIQRKAEWPRWIPTPDMIAREPERYGPYKDGLDGGPTNPLGARALYIYQNGKDTYYRLHGTNDPYTIGTMVSSGCIRLMNHDIIDLYNRVSVGATVDVRNGGLRRVASR